MRLNARALNTLAINEGPAGGTTTATQTVAVTAVLQQVVLTGTTASSVLQATEILGVGSSAELIVITAVAATADAVLQVRQFARPDADVTTGNWTGSGAGSLASHIDEAVPPGTGDYIRSAEPASADAARVTLTPIDSPALGTVYLRLRLRRKP